MIPPHEGRLARGGGGARTLVKADARETGDLVEVFEQASSAGTGPPLHIHHECAEALYVLEGEVVFEIGAERVNAVAGTFVFVPKDVPHTYTNLGATEASVLFWFMPAARMAGYFEELSNLPSGVRGAEVLDGIALRHGVEIVKRP